MATTYLARESRLFAPRSKRRGQNAIAERFVGTVRRESLDWLLIADRRQLEQVPQTFIDHYNGHVHHER